MMRRFSILLLSLSLVLLASCSNDDNTPTMPEEENNLPKQVVFNTISVPTGMLESGNAEADQALEYIRLVNQFTKLHEAVNPPKEATLTRTDQYWSGYWGYENVMFYWEAWYDNDLYKVEVTADGSFYGYNFNNIKFLEVESSSDGNVGLINLYGPNGFKLSQWDWELSEDEVYTVDYYTPLGGLISVKVNPDLSGELEYYEGDALVFKAKWYEDGSWEWWDDFS